MALLLCPQCFEGGGLTEVMSAEVTSRVAWCSSPDGGEPERLESGSCEIEIEDLIRKTHELLTPAAAVVTEVQ